MPTVRSTYMRQLLRRPRSDGRAEVRDGQGFGVELGRLAGEDDRTLLQHVDEVGQLERPGDVLLDEQQGSTGSASEARNSKISSTTFGARPIDTSSSSTNVGSST